MTEFLSQMFGAEWENALVIIFNLILIESLLSIDNAAVLATMVMDLPPQQRSKALRYGIIGAYVFRGLCLLFAAWLIKIWWLKPLGGLYLLYLAYDFFRRKATPPTEDDMLVKEEKWFYKLSFGLIGPFWATVVAVEVMDLAFSLDNVFAAVAFTDNIWLICTGVFIGILAMRFVAQWFVRLLEKYPFLETSAFLVIGILGLKLFLALPCHFYEDTAWARLLESELADSIVSVITASFFFVPILTSRFFGWPSPTSKDTPASVSEQVAHRDIHIIDNERDNSLHSTRKISSRPGGPQQRPVLRTEFYSHDRYAPLLLRHDRKPGLRKV